MAAADSLSIKIGVDAPGVPAALRTIGGEIGKIGTQASTASTGVAKFGAALGGWQAAFAVGAAGVTTALSAVHKMATALDAVGDRAASVGQTASAIDHLAGTLQLLGADGVDAVGVLQSLDRQLGLAASGFEKAEWPLRKLGLTVKDFVGLDAPQKIALIADRMRMLDTDAERAAVSTRLLGDAGAAMGDVWRRGGEAVRQAAGQVKAAGVVSDEAAQAAGRYTDAADLLGRSLARLRENLLTPLLPGATAAIQTMTVGVIGLGHAFEVVGIQIDGVRDRWGVFSDAIGQASSGDFRGAYQTLTTLGDVAMETEKRVRAATESMANSIAALLLGPNRGGPAGGGGGPIGGGGRGGRGIGLASAVGERGFTISDDSLFGSAVGEIQITDEYADQSAERSAILRRTMEEQEQIEADSLDRRLSAIGSFAASAGDLFGLITDAVEGGAKKQTRAQVAALKAMFVAQKIAALASIAVNTAQAIMASASVGLPAAIPGMIAAGVAGGVATAVVVGETVSGLVAGEGVGRRNKEPGHRTLPVYLRADEAVLPPQATADAYRLSDAIGVAADRAERSERSSGGDTQVAVYLDGERISGGVERVLVGRLRRGHVELARAVQGVRL